VVSDEGLAGVAWYNCGADAMLIVEEHAKQNDSQTNTERVDLIEDMIGWVPRDVGERWQAASRIEKVRTKRTLPPVRGGNKYKEGVNPSDVKKKKEA